MSANLSFHDTLALVASADADPDQRTVLEVVSAGEGIRRLMRRQLAEEGLTLEGFQTLAVLRQESGQARLSRIADRMGITRAHLSPILGRLELSGLITRRRGADDRRSVQVSLTEQGEAAIGRAVEACRRSCRALVRGFDPADRDGLSEGCARLVHQAEALR